MPACSGGARLILRPSFGRAALKLHQRDNPQNNRRQSKHQQRANFHGPDASARKANLSLHIPESAFAHRDGKPAIVPGHPDQSEAWLRLVSTDPEEQMPPPKSGIKLTPQQVKILGKWIEQGAEYQPH